MGKLVGRSGTAKMGSESEQEAAREASASGGRREERAKEAGNSGNGGEEASEEVRR